MQAGGTWGLCCAGHRAVGHWVFCTWLGTTVRSLNRYLAPLANPEKATVELWNSTLNAPEYDSAHQLQEACTQVSDWHFITSPLHVHVQLGLCSWPAPHSHSGYFFLVLCFFFLFFFCDDIVLNRETRLTAHPSDPGHDLTLDGQPRSIQQVVAAVNNRCFLRTLVSIHCLQDRAAERWRLDHWTRSPPKPPAPELLGSLLSISRFCPRPWALIARFCFPTCRL